jgi:hypothetical protein
MKILLPFLIALPLFANLLLAAEEAVVPELDQEEIIAPEGETLIGDSGLDLDGLDLDGIDLDSTIGAEEAGGASDENFVPSIRITEDLPVAFPIDI